MTPDHLINRLLTGEFLIAWIVALIGLWKFDFPIEIEFEEFFSQLL